MNPGAHVLRAHVLVVFGAILFAAACAPTALTRRGLAREARADTFPQWQDVFDSTPEIYAILRPQAIKRDAVYGALFKTLLRVAEARSEMRGVTTLEALGGCDAIVVGIHKDPQGDDAAMVFRGVPASLDAQKMTDVSGNPLFRLVDPRATVAEYEWIDREGRETGAVFVLPDRTWVGTLGEARMRARQAFATPRGNRPLKEDAEALAEVRFEAAIFRASPRLAESPFLGALSRRLRTLTLALMPGQRGVVAKLQYDDEDASAAAEAQLKRLVEALARQAPVDADPSPPPVTEGPAAAPSRSRIPSKTATGGPFLTWLREAKVARVGSLVTVTMTIPARLLEELPRVSGADLSL